MSFQYNQLVPVVFGNGAIRELGQKVKDLGCKKVLCVYDSGVKVAGIAPKAEESLRNAGVEYVVFDKITADPTDILVNECGALAKAEGVDGVVGCGRRLQHGLRQGRSAAAEPRCSHPAVLHRSPQLPGVLWFP